MDGVVSFHNGIESHISYASFCAGIGPLQLGVALVLVILTIILLIVYTREGILKQMNNQTVIIVQHVFLFGLKMFSIIQR